MSDTKPQQSETTEASLRDAARLRPVAAESDTRCVTDTAEAPAPASMTWAGGEHDVVDLDQAAAQPSLDNPSADCSCGVRRTILRYNALSPCGGRALAKLKAAHPDEYAMYLAELKNEALAEFEAKWRRHLAGDHSPRC